MFGPSVGDIAIGWALALLMPSRLLAAASQILAAALVICGTALAQSTPSTPAFDRAGKQLLNNLVRVEGSAPQECAQDRRGFAFIVGETASQLVLFTPKHVVDACNGQPLPAIALTFYGIQEGAARVLKYSGLVPIVDKSQPRDDVAFLHIQRPAGWRSVYPQLGTDAEFERLRNVNFIGYQQKAIVSPRLGLITDPCDRTMTRTCALSIDGLRSSPGLSGGVLFAQGGEVVGFIISASADDDMVSVRADEVRKIAASLGLYWTLYTATEQAELGKRLNSAIRSGNAPEVDRLLARVIDLDRAYPHEQYGSALPVDTAAYAQQFDMVKKVMDHGARQVSRALMNGIKAGRMDLLEQALQQRLDVDCVLNYALNRRNTDAAQRILAAQSTGKWIDLNELCDNQTALFTAIVRGYPQLALTILDLGADANVGEIDRVFIKGHPLTAAILARDPGLIRRFLDLKAKPDVVDEFSRDYADLGAPSGSIMFKVFSPVHAAAFVGDVALLDTLVQRGADADVHENRLQTDDKLRFHDGGTPFEVAILGGRLDMARHLLDKYQVSPFGYRYRDRLVGELRQSSTLTATQRYQAEQLLISAAKDYCSRLAKMSEKDFNSRGDFYVQQNRCRT